MSTTGDIGLFAWFRALGTSGRHAFVGAFGGYALDSYDYQVLPLGLVAIAASLRISTGEAGLLTTVTLVLSAVGGVVAGILIDRIGRVRTLLFTISTYAVFTVRCGFAPNFESLLVLRALLGRGYGGEWPAAPILVHCSCAPRCRGRAVGLR